MDTAFSKALAILTADIEAAQKTLADSLAAAQEAASAQVLAAWQTFSRAVSGSPPVDNTPLAAWQAFSQAVSGSPPVDNTPPQV